MTLPLVRARDDAALTAATELVAGWDIPDSRVRPVAAALLAATPEYADDPRALAAATAAELGLTPTLPVSPPSPRVEKPETVECLACSRPATVTVDRARLCAGHERPWRAGVARASAATEQARVERARIDARNAKLGLA